MKRTFAWLILPVVLGALMWVTKWRAENPPATRWDSQVRALMSAGSVRVVYSARARTRRQVKLLLSEKEKKTFIDSFHLSQQVSSMSGVSVGKHGVFDILCLSNNPQGMHVSIVISLDHRIGKVNVSESGSSKVYDLHPATTKRWIELLLNHPRIGPELRQRNLFTS